MYQNLPHPAALDRSRFSRERLESATEITEKKESGLLARATTSGEWRVSKSPRVEMMSERFTVERTRDDFWPDEIVVLRDREAGSWARVVPGQGANVIGFGARVGGKDVETFLQPSDEPTAGRPGGYGAPVLFPFPSRIRGGVARFRGTTFQIDRGPNQPHAIHGLVARRSFQVERLAADSAGAILECSIEADANVLRQFPFPYRFTITYRLTGRSLRVDLRGENRGATTMPLGFGWHPYFRLPLVPGSERAAAIVKVPAKKLWELEPTLVPTGELLPVPADRDFQVARPLGPIFLDDVYTDVTRASDGNACTLTDPSGLTVSVAAGETFREWVIYAPPTRPTICLEPYTCPPDAFNLADRGLDAGVIVLEPGQSWTDWIEMRIE